MAQPVTGRVVGTRRGHVSVIARGEIRWFRFASPDKRRPVLVLGRAEVLPSRGALLTALFAALSCSACGRTVDGPGSPSVVATPVELTVPKPRGCAGGLAASTRAAVGEPVRLATASQVIGVSVGREHVFYEVYRSDNDQGFWHVPKVGGEPAPTMPGDELRLSEDANVVRPRGNYTAFDEKHVFEALGDKITRTPRDGGQAVTLASGLKSAQGMSLNGDWLYWVDYEGDAIWRGLKVAGQNEIIATGHFPRHVVADCQQAFASIGNYGGPVVAIDLETPHATREVAPFGRSLAIDDGALYVFGPTVYRVPVDGSPVQAIGRGSTYEATGNAVQVALDETNVYWASDDGVWKAPK